MNIELFTQQLSRHTKKELEMIKADLEEKIALVEKVIEIRNNMLDRE